MAVTTWAQGALSTLLPVLAQAAGTERALPTASTSRTNSTRVQTANGLREVLSGAGLHDVVVHRVPHTVALDSRLALDLLDGSAAKMLVAGLDAAALGRVRRRVVELLAQQDARTTDATTLVGVGRAD